jgi:hypothetical protein
MVKRITPNESHLWLKDYFRRRPDIGFWKAVLNIVLYPQSPFEPETQRSPRPGFLFAAGLLGFAIVWFGFFNFAK